jgi:acetyl-CoA C-acetyltransferase
VTGGLTFFGGPGNGYSLHAVATLVERLRAEPGAVGLSTALGWYVTKHACGVYSASPPPVPFADVAASVEAPPARVASASYSGPAVVEAWCAPWSRDGAAEAVIVSALSPDGTRALARLDEESAVRDFLAADPLGERVELGANGVA